MYGSLLGEKVGENILITILGEHISHKNSNTSTYPIGEEDFQLGDKEDQLKCGHIFHQNFISQWLILNKSCHVCH